MVSLILGNDQVYNVEPIQFSAGELQVRLFDVDLSTLESVSVEFRSSDDIITLGLVADTIKRARGSLDDIDLFIPYFPAARQDRVEGQESFGLKVYADIIKSFGFPKIRVVDLHSGILHGMFEAGTLIEYPQSTALIPHIQEQNAYSPYAIVAPDAGALKKARSIADKLGTVVVECTKQRDYETGKIVGSRVIEVDLAKKFNKLIVVDDICDGGYTFIQLAKELKQVNPNCVLQLYVTHGIFSKGTNELIQWYNVIDCYNKWD
jgi:ribose-phosphate pyrophosphokinase